MSYLKAMPRWEFDRWWAKHGEFAEQVTGMGKDAYWAEIQHVLTLSRADLEREYPQAVEGLRYWNLWPKEGEEALPKEQ